MCYYITPIYIILLSLLEIFLVDVSQHLQSLALQIDQSVHRHIVILHVDPNENCLLVEVEKPLAHRADGWDSLASPTLYYGHTTLNSLLEEHLIAFALAFRSIPLPAIISKHQDVGPHNPLALLAFRDIPCRHS